MIIFGLKLDLETILPGALELNKMQLNNNLIFIHTDKYYIHSAIRTGDKLSGASGHKFSAFVFLFDTSGTSVYMRQNFFL